MDARLEGADLDGAGMEGANLGKARMVGAHVWAARMERADLREARMEGAYLFESGMEGAHLCRARLERADLVAAEMDGADLRGARLEGADLRGARMDASTSFSEAALRGAALQDVEVPEGVLSATQIASMFGDASVKLPGIAPGDGGWPEKWPTWILGDAFDAQWRKWQDDPQGYNPPHPPN